MAATTGAEEASGEEKQAKRGCSAAECGALVTWGAGRRSMLQGGLGEGQ